MTGDELGQAVASAEILVNPSTTEAFGNVTLEAMASGVSVVAADVVATRALIDDQRSERMKTLEPARDKRAQADALLDRAAPSGTRMRDAIADEAKALTEIGNSLRIRHSETTQEMINRSEQLGWLFVRMFSFVRMLLVSSGRSA